MKETYYGILMNRKLIDKGIYLFKPQYLIEGKIEDEEDNPSFIDTMKHEYCLANDEESLSNDEESVVWCTISKKELLEKFKDMSLEEAKSEYFETIDGSTHIGFYVYDKGKIVMQTINLRDYAMELNTSLNNDNKEIPLININNSNNHIASEEIEEDMIALTFDEFEKIMESKNYEDLKEKLNIVYESCKNMQAYVIGKQNSIVQTNENQKTSKIASALPSIPIVEEKETEDIEVSKYNLNEIKKFFDEKIIGQEEAKKNVILSIIMNELSDNNMDRSACLLVGPTGSGKTLIAKTVSEYFGKPLQIIDSTQLSIPGYEGANIEDFLAQLIIKTNGDIKKAENGIVVFDEIDKKGSEKNDDVSGRGVLNTLLSFIQGTTYNVKYNGRMVVFDTSKLTIFATGAFTDVANSKKGNDYSSSKIGYISLINDTKEDIEYKKLEREDLVKYGKMPIELIGRFSTICQLHGHTKESLRSILTDSNISALLAEKQKLQKLNIELEWTDEYLDKVVEKAIKLKTGARSLKSTVEESIRESVWEVLENIDIYSGIILDGETVSNNKNCKLVSKDGTRYNLEDIINSKEETNLKIYVKR